MKAAVFTIVAVAAMQAVVAAEVIVPTTNRGSIDVFGSVFASYGEAYQVRAFGSNGVRGEVTRNYHIFDLANLAGTVTAAEITFFHPGENGSGGSASYDSPDPSETITFYEVSTPAATIEAEQDAITVFGDLGSGDVYGTLTADPSVNTVDATGSFQTISLNATAIDAIQAAIDAGADWVIGGSLTTFAATGAELSGSNPNANERIFRGSLTDAFANIGLISTDLKLTGVIAIPEPCSVVYALGIASLGLMRRRER